MAFSASSHVSSLSLSASSECSSAATAGLGGGLRSLGLPSVTAVRSADLVAALFVLGKRFVGVVGVDNGDFKLDTIGSLLKLFVQEILRLWRLGESSTIASGDECLRWSFCSAMPLMLDEDSCRKICRWSGGIKLYAVVMMMNLASQ